MNQDEITRMACEAGIPQWCDDWRLTEEHLERFANLVEERIHTNNKARWYQNGVEAEREACAKVCDDAKAKIWEFHTDEVKEASVNVCVNLAASIRARSDTK